MSFEKKKPLGVDWSSFGGYRTCVLLLGLFLLLAFFVKTGRTQALDEAVLATLYQHATPRGNRFLSEATALAGVRWILIFGSTAGVWLLLNKKFCSALYVVLVLAGGALFNHGLKLLFVRSRPSLWVPLALETSHSFPSGHSMIAMSAAGILAVLLWHTKARWAALGIGIVYTLLIGLSRMVLFVHYPSDVVGGYLVGAFWVLLMMQLLRRGLDLDRQTKPD
ncbi:hypothetical protein ABB02_00696 [Clostridiaceae bacterium JG1575]|nr:hypothetical protein ABB02_00696 [Clostridiaceae bacterium JG1575]